MSALIFLVISAWGGGNLFSFLSQLAYNSGILSKFALWKTNNNTQYDLYFACRQWFYKD